MSAPLDVEAVPSPTTATTEGATSVVCGSVRCIEFVGESVGVRAFTYAAPVDRTGTTIASRYFVATGALRAAAANGDQFLVLTDNTVQLLDGASGAVLSSFTLDTTSSGAITRIAGVGSSWAVVVYDSYYSSSAKFYLLDGASLTTIAKVSITDFPQNTKQFGVTIGPNQYLVWTQGKAWRVDATTGTLLDSSAIALSNYKSGLTSIAFVQDHYQVIWRTATDIYSARLGTNGVMIDVDDDFNQITGGRLLCSNCADDARSPADPYQVFVAYDGNSLVGSWAYASSMATVWSLSYTKLDPVTGLALSSPIPHVSVGDEPVQIAMTPTLVLVRDTNGRVLAGDVTQQPYQWSLTKTPIAALKGVDRQAPSLAYNGTTYFVSWTADGTLYGSRLASDTGAYLDSPPLTIASLNSMPAGPAAIYGGVGSAGGNFISIWLTDTCDAVYSRVIDANGVMAATTSSTVDQHPANYPFYRNCAYLDVKGNGSVVLGAWWQDMEIATGSSGAIRALRVGPDGTHLQNASGQALFDVVQYGTTPVRVVADTTPTEDRRTFGVYAMRGTSYLEMWRLRSQTGVVVTPMYSTTASSGVMASDGTAMLAIYKNSSTVSAVPIDPAAGSTTRAAVTIDSGSTSSPPLSPATAWFDGRSYLVMTVGTTSPYDLRLRRLAPDLTLLDAPKATAGIVVQTELPSTTQPVLAAASNGSGRSLVAYLQPDQRFHSLSIKARFVDNDGLAPTGGSSAGGASGTSSTENTSTGGNANAGGSASGGTGGTLDTTSVIASGGTGGTLDTTSVIASGGTGANSTTDVLPVSSGGDEAIGGSTAGSATSSGTEALSSLGGSGNAGNSAVGGSTNPTTVTYMTASGGSATGEVTAPSTAAISASGGITGVSTTSITGTGGSNAEASSRSGTSTETTTDAVSTGGNGSSEAIDAGRGSSVISDSTPTSAGHSGASCGCRMVGTGNKSFALQFAVGLLGLLTAQRRVARRKREHP